MKMGVSARSYEAGQAPLLVIEDHACEGEGMYASSAQHRRWNICVFPCSSYDIDQASKGYGVFAQRNP